ncbi:MAG: hypothetical protein K0Q74_1176, partial [Gammaproteobacteria bacterium]|nr:hypothetical protein [Gammaproteobacteria bacterium]
MQTPRPHQPGLASADDGLESKEDGTREEERRKIATLLQDHMRAVEQSEKLSEQERQRSSALHDQFCQTLENVLPKKTKPPHAKTKHVAANSSPKDLANIQTLKEQIDENQKEISGLSEKQQKLISDVLTVFAGHKDKSDEILQKLQQEKTVKVQDLRQSRILFKHANDHVEELKVESAKKAPHFQGCRSSIANAGKFYRLGYRSIIALVEQQPALDNLQIKSENSVHGSNIISPNVYIGDKVIGLEDKLEEIQAEFDKVGDQYNALQRDHQENMKKLKTLKLQQVDLSQYERDLLTRLADAQQYVRNSKTKEGKIEKQRKAKQQRIVELEAEIAQKTAEIRDLQSNSSPAGQAQLGHQNTKAKHDEDSKDPIPVQNLSERQIINNALRESRYDGDGALKLALKEIPSADYYTRSAAWQMLHILAKNSQLSQQQTTQVFAIATARLKHDDWYHAWETLLTLAGSSSHLSEAQIISILATVAEGLKDKVAGVRGAAERTLAALAGNQHLSEQRINQMLTTATVGLQNKDKDTWEMLAALAGSSRLSDQQIAKLLATATAGLKNNDEEVQAA